MTEQIQPLVYNKTASGLPGTVLQADLSDYSPQLSFTHAAFWGALKSTIRFKAPLDVAFVMAQDWLGNPITLKNDQGDTVWSGFVWGVTFGAGTRIRRRSLDGYANFVRVAYQPMDFSVAPPAPIANTTATSLASSLSQQAIYGRIEAHINAGGITNTTAASRAQRQLDNQTKLLYTPETGELGRGSDTTSHVIIEAYGWYRTLYYQAYTNNASGTQEIATTIKAILTAKAPFISSDQSQVLNTGTTFGRSFDKYDFAGDVIKSLVSLSSTYVFGIDLQRRAYLKTSKRANTTVDYNEQLDGTVTDAGGGTIPLSMVRPDSILRQVDFVPGSSAVVSQAQTIESVYLAETTWASPGLLSYRAAIAGPLGEVVPE